MMVDVMERILEILLVVGIILLWLTWDVSVVIFCMVTSLALLSVAFDKYALVREEGVDGI